MTDCMHTHCVAAVQHALTRYFARCSAGEAGAATDLAPTFARSLLDVDDAPCPLEVERPRVLPPRPYVAAIADRLVCAVDSGHAFRPPPLHAMVGFSRIDTSFRRLDAFLPVLREHVDAICLGSSGGGASAADDTDRAAVAAAAAIVAVSGGARGMLALLGMTETVGSLLLPPPPVSALYASFNALHQLPPAGGAAAAVASAGAAASPSPSSTPTTVRASPAAATTGGAGATSASSPAAAAVPAAISAHGCDALPAATGTSASPAASTAGAAPRRFAPKVVPPSVLTVGARALAKHCHRHVSGSSTGSSWWGASRGSEAEKNAAANALLARILRGGVWVNVHALPHETPVLEVRVAEGYGARWSADGTSFRGFLEPPMEGGHEAGWRH